MIQEHDEAGIHREGGYFAQTWGEDLLCFDSAASPGLLVLGWCLPQTAVGGI